MTVQNQLELGGLNGETEATEPKSARKTSRKPRARKTTASKAPAKARKPRAAKTRPAAEPTATEPVALPDEVLFAQDRMFAVLDAASAANPGVPKKNIGFAQIEIGPGYAKEWRLIAGALAQSERVFAVGTPRGPGGSYKAGYDVLLVGFFDDRMRVVKRYQQVRTEAVAGYCAARPQPGEDTGTFRSSWLLGYRLGLTAEMDRETVEKTVRGPLPRDGRVSMRSTGTGAWAGYCAARGIEPTADDGESGAGVAAA